jgi:hypothetical protein
LSMSRQTLPRGRPFSSATDCVRRLPVQFRCQKTACSVVPPPLQERPSW